MNINWYYITLFIYFAAIGIAVIASFAAYKTEYVIEKETGQIRCKGKINKAWMSVSFLVLWGLLALADCGTDYPVYKDLFENAKDLQYTIGYHQIEIGFALINYFLRTITDSFILYNIIISFAFVFLIYRTLYKLKESVHLGWAVLAFASMSYLQFMNLKRIYLAAAIIFWAIPYLTEKKYMKYFICVILASLLHTSAIVMIVIPFIQLVIERRFKRWHLVLLSLMVLIIVYLFRYQI